jgi:hypothetical protein
VKDRAGYIRWLLREVEQRQDDGDLRGELSVLYYLVAVEYEEIGDLVSARAFLDLAERDARVTQQHQRCRELRRRIEHD